MTRIERLVEWFSKQEGTDWRYNSVSNGTRLDFRCGDRWKSLTYSHQTTDDQVEQGLIAVFKMLLGEVALGLELCPECYGPLKEVALFTSVDLCCEDCGFRRSKAG